MNRKRKQITDANNHLRNTNIWSIEVDGTSVDDLTALLSWTKNMIGNIRSNNGEMSKNKRSGEVFESCLRIFNTDISSLYISTETDKIYYVYAHCDPSRRISIGKHGITSFAASLGLTYMPFYIGMGHGTRAYDLDRNETHRKVRQSLQKKNIDIEPYIIKDGLTRAEALSVESKLIDIFGLIVNKGFLVNLDEGKNSADRRSLYTDDLTKIGRLSLYK